MRKNRKYLKIPPILTHHYLRLHFHALRPHVHHASIHKADLWLQSIANKIKAIILDNCEPPSVCLEATDAAVENSGRKINKNFDVGLGQQEVNKPPVNTSDSLFVHSNQSIVMLIAFITDTAAYVMSPIPFNSTYTTNNLAWNHVPWKHSAQTLFYKLLFPDQLVELKQGEKDIVVNPPVMCGMSEMNVSTIDSVTNSYWKARSDMCLNLSSQERDKWLYYINLMLSYQSTFHS